MTFQRARSDEQREIRRRTILDTATEMLGTMTVAELSLNELGRRAGMAKSNVFRYFESREAVLLELLDDKLETWLCTLKAALAQEIDPGSTTRERAIRLAEVLSRSLEAEHMLCDLFGAQGGVLEHNVSVEVVKRHKRSSLATLSAMADVVHTHLPELGDNAQTFCLLSLLTAGALSAYDPPPASVRSAVESEPSFAALHMDLPDTLRTAVTAALVGMLPRE